MPARPTISREFVAGYKRRRIIDALAGLTTERSYDETKITDLVTRAQVARKTLYENFVGKEEVLLAAFETGSAELLERVQTACATADGPRQRVEAGLAALLGYIVEQPALAHLCMVESLSATPESTRRYEAMLERFVVLTRDSLPSDERLPETVAETLVGGVSWTIYRLLRSGGAVEVDELQRELTDFMLAPYAEGMLTEAADETR